MILMVKHGNKQDTTFSTENRKVKGKGQTQSTMSGSNTESNQSNAFTASKIGMKLYGNEIKLPGSKQIR
jgi:hypothetical protein